MLVVGGSVGSTVVFEGEDVAFAVGNSLTLSVIAWAIVWFGFVKKTGHRVSGRYFLAIFASGIVGGLVASNYQRIQMRSATVGIAAAYGDVMASKSDLARGSLAGGPAGEMETVLRSFMATLLADQRAYEAEMEAIQWDDFLVPADFKDGAAIETNRFRARRAAEIVAKYRRVYEVRPSEFDKRIEAASLSATMKRQLKESFAKGLVKNQATARRVWEIEEAVVVEAGKAVDVLARAKGRWAIATDQFRFQRQSDLDAFNGHINSMQRLAAEQEALRKAHDLSNQANLKKLLDAPP